MTRFKLIIALAITAFACPLSTAGLGAIDWSLDWPFWFKPDLRLAEVKPSSSTPYNAYVIITNEGLTASKPCWVKVTVKKPTPIVKYYYLKAMPAKSGIGFDVPMGVYLNGGPGLCTEARVDVFNQVSELNESNNMNTYLAPVW